MAEEDGQEKTEAPTQRRREEARKQGQVAVSQDLASGAVLLVGVILLQRIAPNVAGGLYRELQEHILFGASKELSVGQAHRLFNGAFNAAFGWLALLAGGVFAASLAVGVLQTGLLLTPELLTFKWERLSPAEGFQRLFSLGAVVRTGTSLLRVAVVAAIVYWVLRGRAEQIARLGEAPLGNAATQGWGIVMRLSIAVAAALFLIGVIDYVYQRYKFERSLRMSRQELKDELKHEEGDPLIKQRIRRLQREAAQKRMLKEVPRATVVVTNPVHLAVALRYERSVKGAPRVVAKGAGVIAERIVELARRHNVPVLERRPLAQALYKSVPVDREIPAALYQVVAELLAYLYRLRGTV